MVCVSDITFFIGMTSRPSYTLITELRQQRAIKPTLYTRVRVKESLLTRLDRLEHTSLGGRNRLLARLFGSLSIVSFLFFILFNFRFAPVADAYAGKLTVQQGQVTLTRNHSSSVISDSSNIQVGDEIYVPANGLAEIVFIDDTVTKLYANTNLAISRVLIDQNDVKKSMISLNLEQGQVENTVTNSNDEQAKLEVKTPTSLVDTKAGSFVVNVASNGETKIHSTSSVVNVHAIKNNKTELAAAKIVQGYEATVKKDDQPHRVIELKKTDESQIYAGLTADTIPQSVENEPAPLLAATAEQNQLITDLNTQLGFSKVKLHQASSMLTVGNKERTLEILVDYVKRNEALYNLISPQDSHIDFENESLESILTKSHTKELSLLLDDYSKTTDYSHTKAMINYLAVLERTLQDNIITNSLVTAATILPDKKPTNPLYKTELPGKIESNIENIVTLQALIKNASGDQDTYELQQEVNENLNSIIATLNGIKNSKVQREYLEKIIASFPNSADFEAIVTPLANML